MILYHLTFIGSNLGYLPKEDGQQSYFQVAASYAYVDSKDRPNRYLLGEGLVGQVALEKQILEFSQTAAECPTIIRSGLANATPCNLLLLPCLYEKSVKGIIEIGTSSKLSEVKANFLKHVMPSIGIAINTSESRTQMQVLLTQSQQQAEELQSKHKEMRQTNEELQTQQKNYKLNRRNCKLNKKNCDRLMKCLKKGLIT